MPMAQGAPYQALTARDALVFTHVLASSVCLMHVAHPVHVVHPDVPQAQPGSPKRNSQVACVVSSSGGSNTCLHSPLVSDCLAACTGPCIAVCMCVCLLVHWHQREAAVIVQTCVRLEVWQRTLWCTAECMCVCLELWTLALPTC